LGINRMGQNSWVGKKKEKKGGVTTQKKIGRTKEGGGS